MPHLTESATDALAKLPVKDVRAWQDSPVTDGLFTVLHRALHNRPQQATAEYALGRVAGILEVIELIRTFDAHAEQQAKLKAGGDVELNANYESANPF
jgi:hypothetical protein